MPSTFPKLPISVLVVIHTQEGEVLLLERADKAGFWQSVTGSLDSVDEAPAAAARREVAEETGMVLTPAQLEDWQYAIEYEIFPHWRYRYGVGVTHNTEHWFSVQVPRATAVRLAPAEHTAFQWLPYQDAAALCFSPSNRTAILALPERLKKRGRVAR